MTYFLEQAREEDADEIFSLYRTVAATEGGLARTADEISPLYISEFVRRSIEKGMIVIARDKESRVVIGEIHAYRLEPRCFGHLLGELTIAVHPDHQGRGIGRAIFTDFMDRVRADRPDILRVELIARESNRKAIEFYEKLGFRVEGRLTKRIASSGGGFEDDIPMAWLRNETGK